LSHDNIGLNKAVIITSLEPANYQQAFIIDSIDYSNKLCTKHSMVFCFFLLLLLLLSILLPAFGFISHFYAAVS